MLRSNSSLFRFLGPRPPTGKAERNALVVMLAVSGATLLLIAIYYVLNPRGIVGDSLVNDSNGSPIEIPPPSTFPFYAKPVTILFVALIIFSFCFFSLIQRPILDKLPRWLLTVFFVSSIVLFAMSIYEVFFNFSLWSSLLVTTTSNPDKAVNTYPVNSVKVNLVYATKSFVALLFVLYFAILAIRNSLETSNT